MFWMWLEWQRGSDSLKILTSRTLWLLIHGEMRRMIKRHDRLAKVVDVISFVTM